MCSVSNKTKPFITQRQRVICHNNNENKAIFDIVANSNNITLREAREAYDECWDLPDHYKYDCYTVLGVDGKAVEKYLSIIEKLEDTLYPPHEIYIFGYHINRLI
jgi:hypothetical protein